MKKLLILLLFFVSLTLQATTYYIRPDGSNSNTGTSNTSGGAWLTLAWASTHTTSGDIIHVTAGTYSLSTQITLPVGVSIEGDGVTSIFNCTYNSDFTLLLSSTDGSAANGNQHISNILMSGGSAINSETAYGAINVLSRKNVSIYSCKFQYFFHSGVRFLGTTSDAPPSTYPTGNVFHDNIVLDCCTFIGIGTGSGAGFGCLELGGQQDMLIYNNTLTVSARTAGVTGYNIKYWSDGYNKGLQIYSNTMTRPPAYSNASDYFDFSIELWNCRGGIQIHDNTIYGAIDISGNTALTNDAGGYGFAGKIYNNILGWSSWQTYEEHGINLERGQDGGMYIYNNAFNYLSTGVMFQAGYNTVNSVAYHDIVQNVYIYSNIANNIGMHTGSGHYDCNFIEIGDEASITTDGNLIAYRYIYVINNTGYAGSGSDGTEGFMNLHIDGYGSYFFVQNNIVDGFGTAGGVGAVCIDGNKLVSLTHVTNQDNLYYLNFVNGFGYYNGGSAKTSFDVNSGNVTGNPSFVSAGTDFHLSSSSSPAYHAGVQITTPSITTDYAGVAFNVPPSIGAYEYGSGASLATVTTTTITAITQTTASSGGNVTADGGASVTSRGVCWNTSANPTTANSKIIDGNGTGSFTSSITGLTASTVYHVRAYAANSVGTSYGSDVQFTTSSTVVVPTVTTTSVTNITATMATITGVATADGGASITQAGFVAGLSANPTLSNGTATHTQLSPPATLPVNTPFTGPLVLTAGTLYYVVAYATNSAGTAYGNQLTFTTLIATPSVITTVATNITNNGALFGGNVTNNGGDPNAYAGVVIADFTSPTVSNYDVLTNAYYPGQLTNPFSTSVSGLLNPLTIYYYRAYITNSVGTTYGTQYSITTLGYPQNIYIKYNGSFVKTGGKFLVTH
jgi:hypothetical protein